MYGGVSVIIPTARTDHSTFDYLSSVAQSLGNFDGEKELVIAADREVGGTDFLRAIVAKYGFVRILEGEIRKGSARTRLEALREAQHQVVLFTDDDCVVPAEWVTQMYHAVMHHGVVAGNLKALCPENPYCSVDAYVDQLRIRSVDELGNAKYISFPNFGVLRQCLPEELFFASRLNTAEDIDLACRLRLMGIPIWFDESIVIETEYPSTFKGLVRRKIKHAMGIAHLRFRLGPKDCGQVGLAETPARMLRRWVGLSLQAPLPVTQRAYMLLANAAYCVALAHYDRVFARILSKEGG